MKRHLIRIALSAFAAGLATPSIAAQQWCTGTINLSWVNWNGDLMTLPSWAPNHLRLCNITSPLSDTTGVTVSAKTCLSWLSMLLTAQSTAKATTIYYPEAPACSAMPSYSSAPVPGYVMLY